MEHFENDERNTYPIGLEGYATQKVTSYFSQV